MSKTKSAPERHRKPPAGTIQRLWQRIGSRREKKARTYVGTSEVSGQLQLELLRREGCRPSSKVLEIGCGRLHLGVPLIRYLNRSHYVGIDPNEWLRQAVLREREVGRLIAEKEARFLSVDTFDAGALGLHFDLIFSHSVLSHCAHRQLEQFLRMAVNVLAPDGRILSSIRLAEGNAYGSEGTADKRDSMDEEWQYPGNSYFTFATVVETAAAHGLTAVCRPEYTEFYTRTRPQEFHDWLVFYRQSPPG